MPKPSRKGGRGAHIPKAARHPMMMVHPTPDLQRRYNQMMDLRDFGERLRHVPDNSDGEDDLHLRPPGRTSMARSVSAASSRSTEGNEGARRRGRRSGPLTEYERARTSFMRKLKACEDCHSRRVKCEHYDFSLLWDEYNRTRSQSWPSASQAQPELDTSGLGGLNGLSIADPATLGEFAPSPVPSAVHEDILMGITPDASSSNAPPPQQLIYDLEQILGNNTETTNPTSPTSPTNPTPVSVMSYGSYVPGMESIGSSFGLSTPSQSPVLVGKCPSPDIGVWECQYGKKDGLSPSARYNGLGQQPCGMNFPSTSQLLAHYRSSHFYVEESNPPYTCNCRSCGLINFEDRVNCGRCYGQMNEWRYFGNIVQYSTTSSDAGGLSGSHDAGFGGYSSGSAGGWFTSSFLGRGGFGGSRGGYGTEGSSASGNGGHGGYRYQLGTSDTMAATGAECAGFYSGNMNGLVQDKTKTRTKHSPVASPPSSQTFDASQCLRHWKQLDSGKHFDRPTRTNKLLALVITAFLILAEPVGLSSFPFIVAFLCACSVFGAAACAWVGLILVLFAPRNGEGATGDLLEGLAFQRRDTLQALIGIG